MKAVIMAGGMGTRIQSVRSDVPKPMIEICGKPILLHQIENLKACGLTDITIVVGHLGNAIKDFFKDGSEFGVKISYFTEETPLGTAGALFKMGLTEDFLLLCGDVVFDIDFSRFIKFHKEHNAWASLMVHPNGHPFDSSLIVTEILPPQKKGGLPVETNRVTGWLSKEDKRLYCRNLVNAGIEIISPELLHEVKKNFVPRHPETPGKIDLDRDVLKPNIRSRKIFAYHTTEYIKDMGTPERYHETEDDIRNGKVHSRNLSVKQMAVFLDRDGTINRPNGFITKPEQFELLPGVAEAIKKINKSGYLAIVVTNQPVIARGECSFSELQKIHNKMETELGKEGAYLDAIYYCPHHTDKGFVGERIEYKCDCDCRKPKPGMLLQAAKDLNIDLSQSYMIGDSENDVEAGKRAGCRESFMVGDGLLECVEDMKKENFLEECESLKKQEYFKFDNFLFIAKFFLKDKLSNNVYKDPFLLIRNELVELLDDKFFPENENDFYNFFCKKYLKLTELPIKTFFTNIKSAILDLQICNENISLCRNKIDEVNKKRKDNNHYKIARLKYFIKKYTQKKESIIYYISNSALLGKNYIKKIGNHVFLESRVKKLKSEDIEDVNEVFNKFLDLPIPELETIKDIYITDISQFKLLISNYIKTGKILEKIIENVENNHMLIEKKSLFEKIINYYQNSDFFAFNSLVPLFIEGLFNSMCIELGATNNELKVASLNYKLNYINTHVDSFFEYEYFAFSFPILRNKIAHGNLELEENRYLSNMLILDLYSVTRFFSESKDLPFYKSRKKIEEYKKLNENDFFKLYIDNPSILNIDINKFYPEYKILNDFKSSIKSEHFLDFLEKNDNLNIENIRKIFVNLKKEGFDSIRINNLLMKYKK